MSVLNLFLSNTSVLIIINCFTLVFNDFNCKPYLKKQAMSLANKSMVLILNHM